MKKIKRALVVTLALVMLLSMLAACGGNTSTTETPADDATPAPATETPTEPDSSTPEEPADAGEKILNVGTMALHLYYNTSGATESDTIARRLIYDNLFYIDDLTGAVSSDILSGWGWDDDVTLRLDLKDGVYFSDGTQMTGEDIIYTFKSAVDNGNAEVDFFARIDYDASYVADDGLTTYLVYKEVYGAAISTLCTPILSKAFGEAHPDGDDAWWYSPVGSGPYKVGEVVMGTSVELIRRDDYWYSDSTYEADIINLKFYSDATAEYADYVSGNLDVLMNLTSAQVEQLTGEGSTNVVIQSANDVQMLGFNESAVSDPAIREAIAYAVDWDALGEVSYGVLCSPATSHFASTFDAYTNHGKVYEYNPEKAIQVLEDAGISDLELLITCPTFGVAMPEALQYYLGEVGITLKIEAMEIVALIPAMIEGVADLSGTALEVHGNAPKEPNTVVSTFAENGFKVMANSDPEFNALLNAGLNTIDEVERAEIYKEIDQWLYDNFHAIPIAERAEAYCYNTEKIAGMDVASVVRASFANVRFN